MRKKQIKIKYPHVSVDTTQAEGQYEVYVALHENYHLSVYLDEQGLKRLEESIQSIREFQKEFCHSLSEKGTEQK
jgi:hypothetical protein